MIQGHKNRALIWFANVDHSSGPRGVLLDRGHVIALIGVLLYLPGEYNSAD